MTRRNGALALLVVVVGVVFNYPEHRSAQSPSMPSARAAVEETTRLDMRVDQLYDGGRSG